MVTSGRGIPKGRSRFETVASWISLHLTWFTGVAIVTMSVAVAADVVARNVAKPIPGVTELTMSLMVIAAWAGVAEVMRIDGFPKLTMISDKFSMRNRLVLEALVCVFWMFWVSLVAYKGMHAGLRSFAEHEIAEGLIRFPLWPARWAVPIGASFWLIQVIANFIHRVYQLTGKRPAHVNILD